MGEHLTQPTERNAKTPEQIQFIIRKNPIFNYICHLQLKQQKEMPKHRKVKFGAFLILWFSNHLVKATIPRDIQAANAIKNLKNEIAERYLKCPIPPYMVGLDMYKQLLELELFFMKNTYLVIANILQEASDQGQPRLKNCNVIIQSF